MRGIARRVPDLRLDHTLLLMGAAVASVGSLLPWIEGSTRFNGHVSWTGLHDTGEGAMFISIALGVGAWVRWRSVLEHELTPRARFVPLVVAVAALLLWVIAFRKIVYMSWFDLDVGARPQLGLLLSGLGIVFMVAGGVRAAIEPPSGAAPEVETEGRRQRSGAGGDGAASERIRRGGGGRPPDPGGYSVVGRVDRASGRADGERDVGRDRD